ncbi:hypothetical protein F0U61_51340 [Archangium violaceum]|uniref:patatin-like phospholipase family protein n=1 Tax=Archangium violaceum TaxID=83451 RepID=UPI002B2DC2D4|nr:hypothetical protein F0U61_51340 [Archangium violaceum]
MTPRELKQSAPQEWETREQEGWAQCREQVSRAFQGRKDKVTLQELTDQPCVRAKLDALQRACANKAFSDIINDPKKYPGSLRHQYVDLVMEGGGTLGIALVGYIYALESVGLRILNIGGTSAGSIAALLLAAVNKDKSEPKSERLWELLSQLKLETLEDGGPLAQRFVEALRQKQTPSTSSSLGSRFKERLRGVRLGFKRSWRGLRVLPVLSKTLGLNEGEEFKKWIHAILEQEGVDSTKKLIDRVEQPPKEELVLREREKRPQQPFTPEQGENAPEHKKVRLKLIAAEVSTGVKVDFPLMAKFFFPNWQNESPAQFVRASMSVPFFFYPMHLTGLENVPQAVKEEWKEKVSDSELGESCTLVDGGIMSNFPISEFHRAGVPNSPTFGVKLGLEKRRMRALTGELETPAGCERPGLRRFLKHLINKYRLRPLGQFGLALFNSARQTLDNDFIYDNPDYRFLVKEIDTGKHHWLDFDLSPADQVDLFLRGLEAGAQFLQSFNWEDYRKVREHLEGVEKQVQRMESNASGDGVPVEQPPPVMAKDPTTEPIQPSA